MLDIFLLNLDASMSPNAKMQAILVAKQVLGYAMKEKENSDDEDYKSILQKEIDCLTQTIKVLSSANDSNIETVQNQLSALQEQVQIVSEHIGGYKHVEPNDFKLSNVKLYVTRREHKISKFEEIKKSLLSKPIAESWSENEAGTITALSEFVQQGQSDIAELENSIGLISSDKRKSKIGAMKETLNGFSENLNDLVKENQSKLNSEKLNHNGKEFINAIGNIVDGLENYTDSALMSELLALIHQLENVKAKNTTIGMLFKQISTRNTTGASETLKIFSHASFRLSPIVDNFILRIDIPDEVLDRVSSLSKKLALGGESVRSIGQSFLKNPKNGKTQELFSFSELVKDLKNLLFATEEVFTVPEKLRGASNFG